MNREKVIRINFADFWKGFSPRDNFFFRLLVKHFPVELSETPDILFYSVFGCDHLRHKGIRIFYTGENVRPDFTRCDYSFSFDYNEHEGRNCRLPVYAFVSDMKEILRPRNADVASGLKKKFCAFVYSNPESKPRIEFFRKLSKYKQVDSGGWLLNNVGGPVADKAAFIREYKFVVAFENVSYPGYTTEKITDVMQAGSIPIYWGNPEIGREFNPKSFVNVHSYPDFDSAIARIIEIDRDDDLFRSYLREPWFAGNALPGFLDESNILARFEKIFSTMAGHVPVALSQADPLRDTAIRTSYFIARHREVCSRLVKRAMGIPVRSR